MQHRVLAASALLVLAVAPLAPLASGDLAASPVQDSASEARGTEPLEERASCTFEHRGVRSPVGSVGVLDSDSGCQFRVPAEAWESVELRVTVDGVLAQTGLDARLYGLRAGGRDLLASSEAPGSSARGASWSMEVEPDALGAAYGVFEVRIDHLGASAVDVRVDAVLTR